MASQTIPYKIYLNENEMPTAWYNLRADMTNKPAPPAESGHLAAHDCPGTLRRVL